MQFVYGAVWIDGRRYVQNGTWEFGYTPVDSIFTYWASGDPDNASLDLCIAYELDHGSGWRRWSRDCRSAIVCVKLL